jgi:hypothetical protein
MGISLSRSLYDVGRLFLYDIILFILFGTKLPYRFKMKVLDVDEIPVPSRMRIQNGKNKPHTVLRRNTSRFLGEKNTEILFNFIFLLLVIK